MARRRTEMKMINKKGVLPQEGSTESWIHQRFMEGSDEICFTYRRELERLRALAVELEKLPSRERRRYRSLLGKWRHMEQLEAARLKATG